MPNDGSGPSRARYVPDDEVTSPPPAGARVAFIPRAGDDGDEKYATVDDLGGAAPAGVSVVRAFPFAFDTPDLLTGAALYTPTPGDILLDAWIEIDTAWDGTTPVGDLGLFVGTEFGFFYFSAGGGPLVDMTQADSTLIAPASMLSPSNPTLRTHIVDQAAVLSGIPSRFTSADPIKVCVSQDGTNTGDDPGSTVGSAVLFLVTATPATA